MAGDPLQGVILDHIQAFAGRDAANPDTFPQENIADLQRDGVFSLPFPPHLGGQGASLVDTVQVMESVSRASPATALLLSMPLGLAGVYSSGPTAAPPEHRAAWAHEIERVAADYRAGVIYAAANSEAGAGGALEATRTTVQRTADGAFHLTGEKILGSFGPYATRFFSTAKVRPEDLPGAGVVEFFFVDSDAPGVEILADWDGFGMRATESHTMRYVNAPAHAMMGFPNFIAAMQPLSYWYCLFAAVPLGCVATMITALGTPAPQAHALRLRLSEALMRYEALRAYLLETAAQWRPAAGPVYAARVLRTKTYVTQEATRLCAELFALGGGRHYRRNGRLARALADAFAGTALRPPLPLALDMLIDNFALGPLAGDDAAV